MHRKDRPSEPVCIKMCKLGAKSIHIVRCVKCARSMLQYLCAMHSRTTAYKYRLHYLFVGICGRSLNNQIITLLMHFLRHETNIYKPFRYVR